MTDNISIQTGCTSLKKVFLFCNPIQYFFGSQLEDFSLAAEEGVVA